jgi:hypothetical protein
MENQNVQFDLPERSEAVDAFSKCTEGVVTKRARGGRRLESRRAQAKKPAGKPALPDEKGR